MLHKCANAQCATLFRKMDEGRLFQLAQRIFARGEGARHAARHHAEYFCVHELVVHWMTTGCLHYPFASAPSPVPSTGASAASGVPTNYKKTPDQETPPFQLGEIEVDRAAIVRVLRENPLSLNVLLEELLVALEREVAEDIESELEEEIRFLLRSL